MTPATPEQFVTTWQTHDSAQAVASALNITVTAARQRAAKYRKRGVHLKDMPKQYKYIDVKGLNALIKETSSGLRAA